MKYASFLVISRALHMNVFDQPVKNHFFNNLVSGTAGSVFPVIPNRRQSFQEKCGAARVFMLWYTAQYRSSIEQLN